MLFFSLPARIQAQIFHADMVWTVPSHAITMGVLEQNFIPDALPGAAAV